MAKNKTNSKTVRNNGVEICIKGIHQKKEFTYKYQIHRDLICFLLDCSIVFRIFLRILSNSYPNFGYTL